MVEKTKGNEILIIENIPNIEELDKLLYLYSEIFEDAQLEFFKKRIQEKEHLLCLIVLYNQQPIGFKIGYRYNDTTFYSWIGGILKEYRKKGIAKNLAKTQENWAKKNGYLKLRTKSMNRFKPMMILNLKNGFNIKHIYTNDIGQTKIIFEKDI